MQRHIDHEKKQIRIVGCDLGTAYLEAKRLVKEPSFVALDSTDNNTQTHTFSILTPSILVRG